MYWHSSLLIPKDTGSRLPSDRPPVLDQRPESLLAPLGEDPPPRPVLRDSKMGALFVEFWGVRREAGPPAGPLGPRAAGLSRAGLPVLG